MSNPSMKILRDTDGHGYTIYDDMDVGGVIHKSEFWVRADRLHLLVSCASAALAEQNSRVMGGANVLTLGDLLKKAMEAGWTENGPPTQSTDQEGK